MYKKVIAGVAALLMVATSVPMAEIAQLVPSVGISASASEENIITTPGDSQTIMSASFNGKSVNVSGTITEQTITDEEHPENNKTCLIISPNIDDIVSESEIAGISNISLNCQAALNVSGVKKASEYDEIILSTQFSNVHKLAQVDLSEDTTITTLGSNLFAECEDLTKVFFSDKVKCIQDSAFSRSYKFSGNNRNKSNNLDLKNIETIGSNAFSYCSSINTIEFGSKLTTIDSYAFSETGLNDDITIPKSVKLINNHAFSLCTSLKKVVFENGINPSYGEYVFSGCSSLEEVKADGKEDCNTLPASSKTTFDEKDYEGNVLYDGDGNQKVKTITSGGLYMFQGCQSLKSFVVPDTFNEISEGMFRSCTNLTTVTFGEKSICTIIGINAFNECTDSLSEIRLPKTTTVLCYGAFTNCHVLSKIIVSDDLSYLGTAVFGDCYPISLAPYNKESVLNPNQVLIPDKVTSIPAYCFQYDKGIKSVDLNNVAFLQFDTRRDSYAFDGCTSLTKIDIPKEVQFLPGYLFRDCSSLEEVTYSDSARNGKADEIGKCTFDNCTKLKKLTVHGINPHDDTLQFPSTLTAIGDYAFGNCPAFKYIHFNLDENNTSQLGTIGEYAFSECTGFIGDYTESKTIILPELIKHVYPYTFYGCTSLYSIEFKGSVNQIDDSAFQSCSSLESVIVSPTITEIKDLAFSGCSSLKNLPQTKDGKSALTQLNVINPYVFSGCSSLTEISIPANITSIGSNAFEECYKENQEDATKSVGLKKVVFENGSKLSSIADNAFLNCSNLDTLVAENGYSLPSSVAYIGNSSFSNTGITSLKLNKPNKANTNLTFSPSGSTFSNCKKLTSVDFSDTNIQNVTKYLFSDCTELKDVKLPETVTNIDEGAFSNCKKLSTINSETAGTFNIPSKVSKIGGYAFQDNWCMASLHIPAATGIIDKSAFNFNLTYTQEDLSNGTVNPLKEIVIDPENQNYASADGIWYNKDKTELLLYPFMKDGESFTIPAGVETLTDYCFSSNDKLKHVKISPDVKNIQEYAFNKCANISSVDFTDNKNVIIDSYAFSGMDGVSIYAAKGSTAEAFAQNSYGVSFVDNNTKAATIEFTDGKNITIPLKSTNYYTFKTIIKTASGAETTDVLRFTTSDPEIATINDSGEATFIKAGTVKITATNASGDVSATIDVTVEDKEGEVKPGNPSGSTGSTGDNNNTNTGTKVTAPAKTAVSSVKRTGLSTLKAYWKKSSGATSYQVQLSSNKSFKGAKTVSTTKTSASFKASVSKTYYVRVRAVKTVNGKKAYSGWSTIKGIAAVKKPAKTVVTAKSTAKKTAKFSWRKVSGAAAYQVQYSSKSNFKGAKTILVSNKATSKTIKKLASKKKYYVRVRAFKKVAGKRYYGSWSAKKAVKIK